MTQSQEQVLSELALSSHAKAQLRKLIAGLKKRLGEALYSVCLYGSAARGEWQELTSDLNVLLLFRTLRFEYLEGIGELLMQARKRARIVPMLLTVDELRQSSDVFCIKFDDIKQHHVCVYGDDPLEALQIDDTHLRFVCEFELRNIAMKMRQLYLRGTGDKRFEQGLLIRFFTSAIAPLRVLCGLLKLERPVATVDLIEVIGLALDTDVDVLQRLVEVRRSGERLPPAECARLYERFHALILLAIERVDALDVLLPTESS